MADSIYTTTQGDTWDIISLNCYGSTKYTHLILDSNLSLSYIAIFDSGTEIIIPEISGTSSEDTSVNLPPWRTE